MEVELGRDIKSSRKETEADFWYYKREIPLPLKFYVGK